MTVEKALHHLSVDGFYVMEDVVPKVEAERIRESVLTTASEGRPEDSDIDFQAGMIARDQSFAEHLANSRVLGVANALFGDQVSVSFTSAIINNPGNPRGGWHSDWPFNQRIAGHIPAPYPDVTAHLTTIWMWSPFSEETGGTLIVPGSHRSANNPTGDNGVDPMAQYPTETNATGGAGSVLLFDSRCWHATATNTSDTPRVGLAVRYAPWWLNLDVLMPGSETQKRLIEASGFPATTFRRCRQRSSSACRRKRNRYSNTGSQTRRGFRRQTKERAVDFDTLIKNGTIVDGTGRLRYDADVGVKAGKIAAIGHLGDIAAAREIDASGLVVAPGFIDMHSHSDMSLFEDPGGESKVHQGVTTEVTGNCSYSPFPIGTRKLKDGMRWDFKWGKWTDLEGWAETLDSHGISINIAPQVGQAAIQTAVGATEERRATDDEMRSMKRLAAEAVEQGAFSMTTGLNLSPSGYMTTDEVVELCQAISGYEGAFYATHARVGAGRQLSMIEEAIEIGRRAEIPVEFSHMAITDRRFYGHGSEMTDLLERAREEGVDITYDVYPYTAAQAGLDQLVPIWVQTGGIDQYIARLQDPATRSKVRDEVAAGIGGLTPEFDTWVIASVMTEANAGVVGKSVEEIASQRGIEPAEAVLQIEEEEHGGESAVIHNRVEGDVRHFLTHPLAMIGSDGEAISPNGARSVEQLHPRFYGTYPRILGRYVREQSLLTLETAVHKMSGFPAERLSLGDRGRVAEGFVADLAIFDPNTVIDRGTFEAPHALAEGVRHVLVNGAAVVEDGQHTGARAGRVLRRGS